MSENETPEETSEEILEKLVVFSTNGMEDPEKASIPFVMANAGIAMDAEVVVVLQAAGVTAATKGMYEHVHAAKLPPLKELVDQFLELGGKIYVCGPCVEERQITKEMLVEGAKIVKAGRVITEVLDAKAVLNY